jgi:hypothetical protein
VGTRAIEWLPGCVSYQASEILKVKNKFSTLGAYDQWRRKDISIRKDMVMPTQGEKDRTKTPGTILPLA